MRTALVTGGARRIGRAIVERLASAGYAVAMHCHRSDHDAHALKRALQAKGARAEVVAADLADGAALAALVRGARTALGPLTLLVNNASAFEPDDIHSLEWSAMGAAFPHQPAGSGVPGEGFRRAGSGGRRGAIVNVVDQRV